MSKCAVLVNTCDAYEDLWNPYFSLFQEYWKDCPFPVYVNTEHKQCIHPCITITTLNQKEDETVSWGKRIRECLDRIDADYVFLSLDDFFLRQNVRTDKIKHCIEEMDAHSDIAVFYFLDTSEQFHHEMMDDHVYPDFELGRKGIHYLLNLQAGIWRKSVLEEVIHDFDTPWTFEWLGSKHYIGNDRFYYLKKDADRIFDYGFKMDGMGVFRGKWVKEDVVPLFESHGIQVDYEKRGYYQAKNNPFIDLKNRIHLKKQMLYYDWHYYRKLDR